MFNEFLLFTDSSLPEESRRGRGGGVGFRQFNFSTDSKLLDQIYKRYVLLKDFFLFSLPEITSISHYHV